MDLRLSLTENIKHTANEKIPIKIGCSLWNEKERKKKKRKKDQTN